MGISLVVVLIFFALLLGGFSIVLLVRDLGSSSGRQSEPERPTLQLQSETPPLRSGLAGRVDLWLNRLTQETGLDVSVWTVFLAMLLSGILFGAVGFLWTDMIAAALGVAVVGTLLPLAYFVYKRHALYRLMDEQLPGILDVMVRAVRAGQSVDEAFRLAGQSGAKPTACEFGRVASQLEMGLSMSAAMQSFVRRVPLHEVRIVASALTVQRRAGGNIAQVMGRVANIIRDRQSYRRSFRATTAGARLALGLIGLCVPAYLIFLLFGQPEYGSQFFAHPHGAGMFFGAVALMLCGIVWIGLTLKSEY